MHVIVFDPPTIICDIFKIRITDSYKKKKKKKKSITNIITNTFLKNTKLVLVILMHIK
jgi:hypothetical protein